MRHEITIHNHPFPFLLYLEWSLLGLAVLSELLPEPIPRPPHLILSITTIGCVLGFGLMGLRIPTRPLWLKLAYTALEFGLILLVTIAGFPGLRLFPFLYLILVIRGCLMFELMGRLFVTGTTYLTFLVLLIYRLQSLRPLRRPPPVMRDGMRDGSFSPFIVNFSFNLAALFGLALVFVLLLVNALLAERRNQEQLVEANQQLRDYALRVENLAMEQERSRIAREIHDSLGHSLTALNIQLEGALKLWQTNPEKAQQFLRASKQLGSTALQDVRHSVSALRTNPLQDKGLQAAISELAHAHAQATGVTPTLELDLPEHLPTELQTAIYRITQEALTNIARHANAQHVTIQARLASTDVQADMKIAIADDGQGFQPELNTTGFGLQGMRERTLALQGEFQIESKPGQGCRVMARLPLSA